MCLCGRWSQGRVCEVKLGCSETEFAFIAIGVRPPERTSRADLGGIGIERSPSASGGPHLGEKAALAGSPDVSL